MLHNDEIIVLAVFRSTDIESCLRAFIYGLLLTNFSVEGKTRNAIEQDYIFTLISDFQSVILVTWFYMCLSTPTFENAEFRMECA